MPTEIQARFEAALSAFVEKIKNDPNILSIILCGSLANDTVWEKSDMDLLVLVREMKLTTKSFCVDEDGLILNVNLLSEFDFKRSLERNLSGDGMYHMAKVVYAKDEGFRSFVEDVQKMGADDRAMAIFRCATDLIYFMEKIEKWLTVKDDPLYAQLWCLKAVELYANMRLVLDKRPTSRKAVLKVMAYAPEAIAHLYERPLQGNMRADEIWDVLKFYQAFLEEHLDLLKQPVADYMSAGESYTVTMLVKHFGMCSHAIYHIFDFLAEMGVVTRITEIARITPKSRRTVEEVAFMYTEGL